MVPVLSETGSLMAYVLYEDPTGLLRNPYSCMSIPRAVPEHSQTIPRAFSYNPTPTSCGNLYNKAFGCVISHIAEGYLLTRFFISTKKLLF
jgi:hypothetical protein